MVNPEAPAGVLVAIAAALVVATITVLLGDSVVSIPVDPTSDDPEEVTEELERAEAGETAIGAATGPFPMKIIIIKGYVYIYTGMYILTRICGAD
jgi:hypothetical protein